MPTFRFILHMYDSEWSHEAACAKRPAGAYTTRYARAASVDEALAKALANTDNDLKKQGYNCLDKYSVEDAIEVKVLAYLGKAPGRGFTFYSEP